MKKTKQTLSELTEVNYLSEFSFVSGKMPPNALDFEKLVIGALLSEKTAFERVMETLKPRTFYDPRHSIIYEALESMYKRQIPIDMGTIIMELKRTEKLASAGGDMYIIELITSVSSSAHLEYHAKLVYEKFILRAIINKSAASIDMAYKETTDVFDLLGEQRKVLDMIDDELNSMKSSETIKETHAKVLDELKTQKPTSIPIQFKDLQDKIGGWPLGSFNVIGARSGIGKSTLGLNFATSTSIAGTPTGLITVEMTSTEVHKRAISNICDISFFRLITGKIWDNEIKKIYDGSAIIEKMPFFYDESVELYAICSKIRKMAKKGVKLVIVDYIQIVALDLGRNATREQVVATICRVLKHLAKELQIVIIGISQTLKSSDNRPSKRPMVSELRESSAIESEADIIMLLYRPEHYGIKYWDVDWNGQKELETAGEMEINVVKFRNGQPFVTRVKFNGDKQRIMNLDDVDSYDNPAPFSGDSGPELFKDDDSEIEF